MERPVGTASLGLGAALTPQGRRLGCAAPIPGPEFRGKTARGADSEHEDPGARQAGGRQRRQGPRQGGRLGRRARQRQDVDEPVRRDRRRRGAPAEGSRQGDRGRRGLDRAAAGAETIRTALAMGADRGILVKTDGAVEPLAVAKILKASSTPRSPASSSSASRRSTTTATRPARCWPRSSAGRRAPSPRSS